MKDKEFKGLLKQYAEQKIDPDMVGKLRLWPPAGVPLRYDLFHSAECKLQNRKKRIKNRKCTPQCPVGVYERTQVWEYPVCKETLVANTRMVFSWGDRLRILLGCGVTLQMFTLSATEDVHITACESEVKVQSMWERFFGWLKKPESGYIVLEAEK